MKDRVNLFEDIRKIYKVLGELSINTMENPLEINRILGLNCFPSMNDFLKTMNETTEELKTIYDESIKNKEKLFYDSIESLKNRLKEETRTFMIDDGQIIKFYMIKYGKYIENYNNNGIILIEVKINFDIMGTYDDSTHIEVYREQMLFKDDKFVTSGNIIKYDENIYMRNILPHFEFDTPLFRDESIVEAILNDDHLYKYIGTSLVSGYGYYNSKEKASLLRGFIESDSWDTHIEPINEKGTFVTMGTQYWKPEGINQAQYTLYDSEYREKEVKINEENSTKTNV